MSILPLNSTMQQDFKIRLLLTGKCTAKCSYCHNEGQSKESSFLRFEDIEKMLNRLENMKSLPSEIVLTGGEPTLHARVKDIAQLCKSKGIYLSMTSHVGHTSLLEPILPYLDELKIHLDSFNSDEQFESMGIELSNVKKSIELAKKYSVKIVINHPLVDLKSMQKFIQSSRDIAVDCKIIEVYDSVNSVSLKSVDWGKMGYIFIANNILIEPKSKHTLYLKSCEKNLNLNKTLFIGIEGIRSSLEDKIDFFNQDIVNSIENSCNNILKDKI